MRILFCGTPDFAAVVLDALLEGPHLVVGVVSQPSRPQGRGLKTEDPPAVERARAAGIPVFQTQRLHAAETLDAFRALEPELIVTAAFGRILRPSLLELAAHGSWNVHASLLPRHRGASPITAALLAGDAWTGVTLFRMDEGLDTGPILAQEMTPIGPEETAGDLTARLARLGGTLLRAALDREQEGSLRPVPQPEWGATYAPVLSKEDGRIRWNRPADQIERLVRAVTPWPGAWTLLEGKRLRIHRLRAVHRMAAPVEARTSLPADSDRSPREAAPAPEAARPGTLVQVGEGIGVTCLPGLVLLEEVQVEGRKRQEAAEWLRGSRTAPGTRLDPPA